MEAFYAEGREFLRLMNKRLQDLNLDLSAYYLDHLCYRVATMEEYRSLKAQLCLEGDLLHEAMIGGRPIASFKLRAPITNVGRDINIIELPSPKNLSAYPTGFEHAEFVVEKDLLEFAKSLMPLMLDMKGLVKKHNPELKLELAPGMNIKFHRVALEALIREESGKN